MTREEKINTLNAIIQECEEYQWQRKETLFEIIQDLEQESCEDCVSRQAVLEQTYNWSKDEFLRVTNPFDCLRKKINSLPPVKPQEIKAETIRGVIDKIRAEILRKSSYEGFELGGVKDGYHIAVVNILNILDKYIAESEG